MIAHGNAHILLVGIETWFQTTVACQDIVLAQHVDNDLRSAIRRQHLAEEVVGLGRHHTQIGNGAQLLLKVSTLGDKLGTSLLVVLLVLVVYLHEELGKGVEVPY